MPGDAVRAAARLRRAVPAQTGVPNPMRYADSRCGSRTVTALGYAGVGRVQFALVDGKLKAAMRTAGYASTVLELLLVIAVRGYETDSGR